MRAKRIDLIEEYIMKHKSVSLDTLCEEFLVSKNTIRRDIDTLLNKGMLRKVYGGVTLSETSSHVKKVVPFEERHTQYISEKNAISRIAAQYVQDDDIIYVDTGTTCLNLIDHISDKKCTIITNSLQVCLKAIPYPNLNVLSLPGHLQRDTLSFVGNEIVNYFQTINIGKAFMTCTGVTIENGLTNATMEEYAIKRVVMDNSQSHFLLADHTKFGRFSLMTYCDLNQVQHIVTDDLLPDAYTNYCREHRIAVDTVTTTNN